MTKRKSLTPEDAPVQAAHDVPIFKPTEPEPKTTATKGRGWRTSAVEEEYARRYGRPTSYRLSDALRDRFKAIAEAEGVGLSELAEYALTRFVQTYDAGEIALPKQQTAYALDFEPLE